MLKVPASILEILVKVPEKDLHTLCIRLKITETAEYKSFIATNLQSKRPCTSFLVVQLTSGNESTLRNLYHSIEGYLFVGGCTPGIGIAFNLVDACFCFALGNFFGCFVAIVSCFPIPGFKVGGKALEKILNGLLKHIPVSILVDRFYKELNKRLIKGSLFVGTNGTKSLMKIREGIEEIITDLYNPFTDIKVIPALAKLIKRLPQTTPKTMLQTTPKTQKGIATNKTPFLGFTSKGIINRKIRY